MFTKHATWLPNLSNLSIGARCKSTPNKRKIQDDNEEYKLTFILSSPLKVEKSTIDNAGEGLFATEKIPQWSIFAEYYGPVGSFDSANTSYAVRLCTPATPQNDAATDILNSHGEVNTVYGDALLCPAAKANTHTELERINAIIVSSQDPRVSAAVKSDSFNTFRLSKHEKNPDALFRCERLFLVTIKDINPGGEIFLFYNREADLHD